MEYSPSDTLCGETGFMPPAGHEDTQCPDSPVSGSFSTKYNSTMHGYLRCH